MARKSNRKSKAPPLGDKSLPVAGGLANWWRPVCLAMATGLLVATPLIPSERTELTGAALPLVMLWLLLALVWFAGAALLGVRLGKLGWIDLVVVALVGWQATSAVVMMRHGAPRPTFNALWTWVSFAVIVVMLRQLVREAREARALCAVMIALAVCLSVMALYQATITYPAQRAYYEASPDAALFEAGVHAPEGSAARKQFESRLYSSEPTATFSLTNSLAGFLAPWFVIVLGLAAVTIYQREPTSRTVNNKAQLLGFALTATMIAICLALTKSRTAVLATIIGCAALIAILIDQRGHRRKLLIAFAIGALLLIPAVMMLPSTSLGHAAALSLKYRFEYWQSTAAMIADYPIFGCGVGNFQEYYTTYKLPQASETVADPHNFLMEVGATAGLPAVVLLLVLLAVAAHALRQRGVDVAVDDGPTPAGNATRFIYVGAAAGIVLAIPLGIVTGYPPPMESLFLGALFAAASLWSLRRWTSAGELPLWLAAVAIAVLLINLLAAGGISFPGVAMTLWVLIAVMTFDTPGKSWRPSPVASLVLVTPVVVGLLLTGYSTGYQPVLRRQSLMAEAGEALNPLPKRFLIFSAINFAEWAAEADPWSAQPHLFLAGIYCQRCITAPHNYHAESDQLCRFHGEQAIELDRHSARTQSAVGLLNLLIGMYLPQVEAPRKRAVAHFQSAAGLYPNDAMTHAQLAMACHQLDEDDPRVKASAAEALRLDALCPHEERKLANRQIFAEIGVASPGEFQPILGGDKSAQQWMEEIINTANEQQ